MMSETESEQFSLRWNNFHSNLTSGFHALLQGEDLVDVTLAAGGQFVQAHKIVLSVCSPYFKELFKVNPCKHPIVILKDVCHKELLAILQFMYQGEVNVRQEELATFLKTAEMLQIKGLTGDDSPSEEECTSIPTPQAIVRQRAPRRVVEKIPQRSVPEKKPPPPPVETIIAETEKPLTPPPFKRVRQEVPSPVISSPIMTEDSRSVEMPDIANPKQEPIDYDAEIEEVDRIQNRDDTLAQLLGGGESSQTLQDTSQGSSIFAGIPSASQDSGVQDSGQGPHRLLRSTRGRHLLVHNGFLYRTDACSGNKIYWRCCRYHRGCRGRVVTVAGELMVKCSNHNHEPQDNKIKEQEALSEFNERAILAMQRNNDPLSLQAQYHSQLAGQSVLQQMKEEQQFEVITGDNIQ